ncbi:MAG: metal ABC transporter ATP-binding protein [bacterium]
MPTSSEPTSPTEFYLEARDLTVRIGEQVLLDAVSFSLHRGRLTALVGPNGAGKSTLIKTMLGLIPFAKGNFVFAGKPWQPGKSPGPKIGYIPQFLQYDTSLPLTVAEFLSLRLAGRLFFPGRPKDFGRAREALEKVHSPNIENHRLGELSGGQFQRVLLAYSLLDDPELLLLDEPLVGVDRMGEETFYGLLADLVRVHGKTIVLVSHDIGMVHGIAEQVLCLNRRLVCSGTPETALTHERLQELYGDAVAPYHHTHHTAGPNNHPRRNG